MEYLRDNIRDLFAPRTSADIDVEEVTRKTSQLEVDLDTIVENHTALRTAYREECAEHAALTGEYEKACEHIRRLRTERDMAIEHSHKLVSERDQLQQDCHEAERSRQKAAEEAEKARTQLTSYKSELSVATKIGNQISDGEVCSRMDRLFYSIQDFAISATRSVDLDISKLNKGAAIWLKDHIPGVEKIPKAHKPYIITALVAKSLLMRFQTDKYFGLSADTEITAARRLARAFTGVETAGTKDWLEPTRKLLGSLDEQALQESDQALVDSMALEMHSILDPVLQGTWKPTAEKSLRKIVQSAFELFRMLHSSKALFQIEFTPAASPRGKLAFDAAMMQALASEEDHGALRNQLLQVSVFPGVFKYGDEMGNNLDELTVICRARVILQKESHLSSSSR
ncbi:hypothetical protein LTR56_026624 [Elasticomyces elasticus]|nr:hypothetical protein LTR56_026624 [Elasticomyces elasticus]KAK4901485.1 hypothetical protein LTR49_027213 [Elasticomyces elasticus]